MRSKCRCSRMPRASCWSSTWATTPSFRRSATGATRARARSAGAADRHEGRLDLRSPANTDGQAFAMFDAIGRPELEDRSEVQLGEGALRQCALKYFSIRAEGLKQKTSADWARHSGEGRCARRPRAFDRHAARGRALPRRRLLPQDRAPGGRRQIRAQQSGTSSRRACATSRPRRRISAPTASRSSASSAIRRPRSTRW